VKFRPTDKWYIVCCIACVIADSVILGWNINQATKNVQMVNRDALNVTRALNDLAKDFTELKEES
jgi:hypothetical protein